MALLHIETRQDVNPSHSTVAVGLFFCQRRLTPLTPKSTPARPHSHLGKDPSSDIARSEAQTVSVISQAEMTGRLRITSHVETRRRVETEVR